MKLNYETSTKKFLTTRNLTVIAMLSAVASVLMLFEIPLWFAPPTIYKLDFSEVPVLIGAFAIGPMAGVIIELVKVLLNLILNGTVTMGVGEFANFLIGISLVVPAALIYYRRKTFKNAVVGMIVGTLFMTVVGSVLNGVVLLPVYAFFINIPLESLVQLGSEVNSSIVDVSTFVILAVAPFNLIKGIVVSAITILLYKRLNILIKSFTRE